MTGTGIVRNLPFEQYQNIDAWNPSTVLHGRDGHGSMLNLNWRRHNPQPSTPVMDSGTRMHAMVLEPDSFSERYIMWDGPRRGKEYNEWCASVGNKEIITVTEYEQCLAVRLAVHSHPVADRLLCGDPSLFDTPSEHGDTEVSIVWNDHHTGLLCKSRIDLMLPNLLVDLKTVGFKVADHFAIKRNASTFGWHISMAARQDGICTLTGEAPECKLILVEQKAPHDCRVMPISNETLGIGYGIWQKLLAQVKECEQSGHWPGCDEGETDLPVWDDGSEWEVK